MTLAVRKKGPAKSSNDGYAIQCVGEKTGQSCGGKVHQGGGPVAIVSDGTAYLVVGGTKANQRSTAEYW